MAYTDDLLNAAQRRRTRTGQSYFPAANTYRGININAGPSANDINATPQGQIIQRSGAGNAGYGIGNAALPPDQNPAYQAAISGGRPNRAGYTTITLPSGGTASVPTGSVQKYLNLFPGRLAIAAAGGAPSVGAEGAASIYDPNRAQDITHLQNQLNFPRLYGQGYGNIPAVSAPLNAQERVQRGQSGVGEIASVSAHNLFGVPANQNIIAGLGRNIASWFGGGNIPSIPPTANAGAPSPTPYQTPSPSASPTPTPFKTTDARSDLLRDTEGTFYGGGQVPIPTPTPTPGPNRYVLGQPRRYSDDFGYNQYA